MWQLWLREGRVYYGIFLWSICSSKVWNFLTVKPATPPSSHPLPAYRVNHTYSLSHFPLSVSLSVPHAHKLTFIHCLTLSQLPLHSTAQTSYTSVWPVALHAALCRFIPLSPRLFYLAAPSSPSLPFCLFILAVSADFLFPYLLVVHSINLFCFSLGKSYLPLFCSVSIMRFPTLR